MKLKIIFSFITALLFIFVACEKEAIESIPEIDDEVLALVEEEVLSDINFAELLDEGDDGLFWGDAGFSNLKSAEILLNDCKERTVTTEGNKKIVTLEFNGSCGKNGIITIEYHKRGDNQSHGEKTITYTSFVNGKGTEFNGIKNIRRGNGNYHIKANMEIAKKNAKGETVTITREYERQVDWICGLDTRGKDGLMDNIKKITGKSEITKTIEGGETKTYSRKILEPLLIVKACALKIQAGTVKVEKPDGTNITIDYGQMPDDIECGTQWSDCNTKVEVTKGDETYTVEFDENGKRMKKQKGK